MVISCGTVAAVNAISFGPYRLLTAERLLLKDEHPVDVGSRALDVLIALTRAAGQVIGHRELMERAWPNVVVGKGSIRAAIAELRRVLGDGQNGIRYIANITGRGYSFVGCVTCTASHVSSATSLQPFIAPVLKNAVPARRTRTIGRANAVEIVSRLLISQRFVSVVGAGGLGKTTIAICVAHALLSEFSEAVYFVDLGAVSDGSLVSGAVAAALGLAVQEEDPLPGLTAVLAGRRILLILDNCEHLIDAATLLTEQLYNNAPHVHILTTSREALRAEGEHVYLAPPLDYPVVKDGLTAAEALAFPAIQLLMERASASGYTRALTDADAPVVAAICARLDGIALAIELAGSRVGTYGIEGTADLLNNRFKLLWQGRRSALPRHKTLHAMLDWSFNLLSTRDRCVLARLSVFVGVFTLEAAQAVAVDQRTDEHEVVAAVSSLVEKSLIWVAPVDGITCYRLLDSTVAFASEKLALAGESTEVAKRHALYYIRWRSNHPPHRIVVSGNEATVSEPHIGNIRAALEWCFSDAGEAAIGVRLAVVSAPLFVELSLLVECRRWCEQALALISEANADKATQLTLQEALAASAMFTRGNSSEVRRTIEDGLRTAGAVGDLQRQLNLLAGLNIFLTRTSDFRGAVAVAQRSIAIAQKIGSPAAIATAEWMLGVAYHLAGDQANAQQHCERGLENSANPEATQVVRFGYDYEIRGLVALARTLWFRGFPDRAAKIAERAVDEAARRNRPVDLCIAMIYSSTVFLWRGDLDHAQRLIQHLAVLSTRYSLGPYHAVSLALSGELEIARGEPARGVASLRGALGVLHSGQHQILTPAFQQALAEGLLQTRQFAQAAAVLDAAIAQSGDCAHCPNTIELHRIRGETWLRTPDVNLEAAEREFQLSLGGAKNQSVLSLELRSGTALAQLWFDQGKTLDADRLLHSIYSRFVEGHETADLMLAARLLADLKQGNTTLRRRGTDGSP